MNRRLPRPPQPFARPRRRPVGVAAVGLVAALGLSGCQYTSVIQTDRPYEPADGVSTQVGDLQVRNLLVVAGAKDGPGNIVGMTANPTDQPQQISFALEGGRAIQLTVPPQGSVQLSTPDKLVPAGNVSGIPGDLTAVQISSPAGGTRTLNVPIKYPQGPYEEYAPAGWTPPPSPSPTTTAGGGHH